MTQAIAVSGPAFRVRAEICGRTEIGPTRTQNQDAIMVAGAVGIACSTRLAWAGDVSEAGVVVAVVDGMGGHAGGAEAAALIATSLAKADLEAVGDEWDGWFEQLSGRVARAGSAWATPDMGATVAMLGITRTGLVMANVGDCRIYRVVSGHLGQLSVDDRTDDPASHAVTQVLGGSARIDAHLWRQAFKGGRERYVLCSDGVWGTLDPAVLRYLCAADRPPEEIADGIAGSIYSQHADDNCSVIVVDFIAMPADETTTATTEPGNPSWWIDARTPPRGGLEREAVS